MPNVTKPLTQSFWLESCSLHIGYEAESSHYKLTNNARVYPSEVMLHAPFKGTIQQ